MPRTPRTGAEPASKAGELSYEDALKRLEDLVESMESGELPLEALLSRFEEGTRLAQLCQAKLAAAELRIQKLEANAEGALDLKPFDTRPDVDPK